MNKLGANEKSPVLELESRARLLFDGVRNQDKVALQRVRKQLPKTVAAVTGETVMLVVARECGFRDWQMAIAVFEASLNPGEDYGDFWYAVPTDVLLNLWCRNYDEALAAQAENGGFLLPYRRQFVVVQNTYIEILGMDPADPAWEAIHHNLTKPADKPSYDRLVMSRLKGIFHG